VLTKRERLSKVAKRISLALHSPGRGTVPVFIFGVQRSGTNMLIRTLNRSPRTECYYESDEEAFEKFRLRDAGTIAALIGRSRADAVVFKPIADSQNARDILAMHPGAKAIWAYRRYEDVVNSALRNFKQHREFLRLMIEEPSVADWRVEKVPAEDMNMVRHYYQAGVSDASIRALIWYLRNHHLFRQNLQRDRNLMLVNYERLVESPDSEFRRVFAFLGLRFSRKLVETVHKDSVRKNPCPEIDPEIRKLCETMWTKLEAVYHG